MSSRVANASEAKLRAEIVCELRSLPYPAFLSAVAAALTKSGYEGVSVLRRSVARGSGGGYDLAGKAKAGHSTVPFVGQAKQYAEPVPQRYVDELRGVAHRTGANLCVIVSTSAFSPTARVAAARRTVLPVRLMSGNELACVMIENYIGVIDSEEGLRIDRAFFEALAKPADSVHNGADSNAGSKSSHFVSIDICFGERTSCSEPPSCGS